MNMKENIIFLRNEWTTTGEVDKTNRTDLGKCIHLYDETQWNNETQALSTENCLRQVQENRQIIINEKGSKEEDRPEDVIKMTKIRRFLSGQIVANTELQNKRDLPTVCRPYFSYNPDWFCCQANNKVPKVGQVFPNATCNNHSFFVVLFVDWWSWRYSLEKFNGVDA